MAYTNDIGTLLHRVSSALDRNSDQILQERIGITLSQFRVLLVLLQGDGQKQAFVADELGQSEPSITRQVKILEERNLVLVRPGTDDRRDRLLFLTGKGEMIAQSSVGILNSFHGPMLEQIGIKHLEDLQESLNKIENYVYEL